MESLIAKKVASYYSTRLLEIRLHEHLRPRVVRKRMLYNRHHRLTAEHRAHALRQRERFRVLVNEGRRVIEAVAGGVRDADNEVMMGHSYSALG